MKKTSKFYSIPYFLWIFLFVLAPVALLFYKSFFDVQGHLTLTNYQIFLVLGLIYVWFLIPLFMQELLP